jgi:phage tail sheath protein FI
MSAMCSGFYRDGALYGAEPAEAFQVLTGPEVNPPDLLRTGRVGVELHVQVSPTAERVVLLLAKHSTDLTVAA